jgi:PHP family Zn ribbon phosphoesterase
MTLVLHVCKTEMPRGVAHRLEPVSASPVRRPAPRPTCPPLIPWNDVTERVSRMVEDAGMHGG